MGIRFLCVLKADGQAKELECKEFPFFWLSLGKLQEKRVKCHI
jgi:hypothetical protein